MTQQPLRILVGDLRRGGGGARKQRAAVGPSGWARCLCSGRLAAPARLVGYVWQRFAAWQAPGKGAAPGPCEAGRMSCAPELDTAAPLKGPTHLAQHAAIPLAGQQLVAHQHLQHVGVAGICGRAARGAGSGGGSARCLVQLVRRMRPGRPPGGARKGGGAGTGPRAGGPPAGRGAAAALTSVEALASHDLVRKDAQREQVHRVLGSQRGLAQQVGRGDLRGGGGGGGEVSRGPCLTRRATAGQAGRSSPPEQPSSSCASPLQKHMYQKGRRAAAGACMGGCAMQAAHLGRGVAQRIGHISGLARPRPVLKVHQLPSTLLAAGHGGAASGARSVGVGGRVQQGPTALRPVSRASPPLTAGRPGGDARQQAPPGLEKPQEHLQRVAIMPCRGAPASPKEHDVGWADVHLHEAHAVQLAERAGHVVQQNLLLLRRRPRLAQHLCQREVAPLGDDEGRQVLGALLRRQGGEGGRRGGGGTGSEAAASGGQEAGGTETPAPAQSPLPRQCRGLHALLPQGWKCWARAPRRQRPVDGRLGGQQGPAQALLPFENPHHSFNTPTPSPPPHNHTPRRSTSWAQTAARWPASRAGARG